MSRTALLIRCAKEDADRIRAEAEKEQRTISSYVASAAMMAVRSNELLSSRRDAIVSHPATVKNGNRAAILVRCRADEAHSIREAAKRRSVPLNTFVIRSVEQLWQTLPSEIGQR